MIIKDFKANIYANKINRIMTGEPDPEPVIETPVETESPKEEKKEEPKAAAGEGLANLFG